MLLAEQDGRPLIDFTLDPLLEDFGIPLAVMGIFVVFTALALLVVFITLLPRVLERFLGDRLVEPARVEAPAEDELPEETVAVIAAAVAETLGGPHRIVRIRGLTPEDLGWSLKGRIHHHQSHRIQRRDRR